ncbi:hypothetical protein CLOM_g16639 [Closterium sp. NIES-68]|nr:hypothetical protein CLOM_g16639 [Closterium sp. NIES-68]
MSSHAVKCSLLGTVPSHSALCSMLATMPPHAVLFSQLATLTASVSPWLHCLRQHPPSLGCTALDSISPPLAALPLTASDLPWLHCP